MKLSQIIQQRCCTRSFSEELPSKEQITAILEAGRLAPSWVNVQPWHFIVVQNKETIELLGKLSFDQAHVKNANTIIVCCGTLDSWQTDKYKEVILTRPNISKEKVDFLTTNPTFSPALLGNNAVIFRTLEELTYAVAYMTLEIENQGLAGCIIGGMGGPLTKSNMDIYESCCKKLQLPEETVIMTMLVIGYAAEGKPEKVRKSFNDVISFNTFGNKY